MEKPLFVKIEDYDDVKEIIKLVRTKMGEAKKNLAELYKLKSMEEEELKRWQVELMEVEKKTAAIEQALAESHM